MLRIRRPGIKYHASNRHRHRRYFFLSGGALAIVMVVFALFAPRTARFKAVSVAPINDDFFLSNDHEGSRSPEEQDSQDSSDDKQLVKGVQKNAEANSRGDDQQPQISNDISDSIADELNEIDPGGWDASQLNSEELKPEGL